MHEVDCIRAHDLGEAIAALAKWGDEAMVLAGGTDLHVILRSGGRQPRMLVAIAGVAGLRSCDETAGKIRLGSALTHAEVASEASLREIGALTAAASAVGSPQIRNVGTLGGNLANASPAGDLYPPLLVLDAVVAVAGAEQGRDIAIDDFAKGPGLTALAPGEIVTGVSFEKPKGRFHSAFGKIGLRNAVAISVANCAILASARDGRFDQIKLACGAVAPRPIRMRKTEALVRGERLTASLAREVARTASAESDPISDIRASAAYRRHVVGVLASRLVEAAWEDLLGNEARSA